MLEATRRPQRPPASKRHLETCTTECKHSLARKSPCTVLVFSKHGRMNALRILRISLLRQFETNKCCFRSFTELVSPLGGWLERRACHAPRKSPGKAVGDNYQSGRGPGNAQLKWRIFVDPLWLFATRPSSPMSNHRSANGQTLVRWPH